MTLCLHRGLTCKLLKTFSKQAHGQNDHGACPKPKFHSSLPMTASKASYAGVPQGSVLASLLSNLYCTSTSPLHDFQKVYLRNNPALLHCSGKLKAFVGTLSQDMTTLLLYFRIGT